MSIANDSFQFTGHFLRALTSAHAVRNISPYHVECRYCRYRVEEGVSTPKMCPKCHGASWERFLRPGSLLEACRR